MLLSWGSLLDTKRFETLRSRSVPISVEAASAFRGTILSIKWTAILLSQPHLTTANKQC